MINQNVMILIFVICLFMAYFSLSPIPGLIEKNVKYQTQLDNINDEISTTSKQYDTLSQEPYRQQQIRSAFHYSDSGDILFVFPEEEVEEIE